MKNVTQKKENTLIIHYITFIMYSTYLYNFTVILQSGVLTDSQQLA